MVSFLTSSDKGCSCKKSNCSSVCKCARSKKPCTIRCECKDNCRNPYNCSIGHASNNEGHQSEQNESDVQTDSDISDTEQVLVVEGEVELSTTVMNMT